MQRQRWRCPAHVLRAVSTASARDWEEEENCWGNGRFGKLGHGDDQTQLLPKPVAALAKVRVVGIGVGDYHSLALTADGTPHSWGRGTHGQLGLDDGNKTHNTPQQVQLPAL